jgi:SAM-dependent methyltransferase
MGEWYKDWFADERYSCLYKNRNDEEAAKLIELVEWITGDDKSRSVLDIPCGAGRHLITLAKRGYTNLHGRDLSPTLIGEAKDRIAEENISIDFAISDIREPLIQQYDLILNLFTSFGYFEKDEEHEAVIRSFAGALSAGGYIVVDFFNALLVEEKLIPCSEVQMDRGELARITKRIESGRIKKTIRFASDGKEFIESVRLYTLRDFREMFTDAGLLLEHTFGDYEGNAFTDTSSRLIMFARRA